jgi:metallo-beta-lactamase family protein
MMEAGRIKHHLANNIENPNNTILAVGYCAPSTLGARILGGADEVSIFGVKHPVKANIERIEAFSGHGDYNEMADFLSCQVAAEVKKVFLVHGDLEAQQAYKLTLESRGFNTVTIPVAGEEFVL